MLPSLASVPWQRQLYMFLNRGHEPGKLFLESRRVIQAQQERNVRKGGTVARLNRMQHGATDGASCVSSRAHHYLTLHSAQASSSLPFVVSYERKLIIFGL